ncbi:SDR family NAD(P)-dependent oxidoreductase [Nocardia alni]|uniref:SDR family NAD(P)-dependent oxidoreductase n=1 Tax=Nocardia alni TaxID=2815723 RepID=UPI001C24CC8E|nr:SDR family oxidoreductase [Nocardia alni]
MSGDLDDRAEGTVAPPTPRVLVTGGGHGLGLAFTTGLVESGARVMICGRKEHHLDAAATQLANAPGEIATMIADVTDPRAVRAAVDAAGERYGGIDVVINNAGTAGPAGPTWQTDPSRWWRTIEVNLRGTELVTRTVVPQMIERGFGRIVNVTSNAGRTRWPTLSAYAVSKAAVDALTANLEGELKGTGVIVVAYDPGLVEAGMTLAFQKSGPQTTAWGQAAGSWAEKMRSAGRFTPLETAVDSLVRVVGGAADHRSGRHVTAAEIQDPPAC